MMQFRGRILISHSQFFDRQTVDRRTIHILIEDIVGHTLQNLALAVSGIRVSDTIHHLGEERQRSISLRFCRQLASKEIGRGEFENQRVFETENHPAVQLIERCVHLVQLLVNTICPTGFLIVKSPYHAVLIVSEEKNFIVCLHCG